MFPPLILGAVRLVTGTAKLAARSGKSMSKLSQLVSKTQRSSKGVAKKIARVISGSRRTTNNTIERMRGDRRGQGGKLGMLGDAVNLVGAVTGSGTAPASTLEKLAGVTRNIAAGSEVVRNATETGRNSLDTAKALRGSGKDNGEDRDGDGCPHCGCSCEHTRDSQEPELKEVRIFTK